MTLLLFVLGSRRESDANGKTNCATSNVTEGEEVGSWEEAMRLSNARPTTDQGDVGKA